MDSEFPNPPPITDNLGAKESEQRNAISDKLRPYVTEERLAANALNYPEMQRELSSRDERQIASVRERILGMPLTHATKNSLAPELSKKEGLKPYVAASEVSVGATRPIDTSLGLDEYTFMNWGYIDDVYGHNVIIVDAHAMLEKTIVTPLDITRAAPSKLDLKPWQYQDLPQGAKESVEQRYFGRMVTGKDWLEIMARKVHKFVKEKPDYPFPIDEYETNGEIKRYGAVPAEYIIGGFKLPEDLLARRSERRKWGDSMWEHGIALGTSPSTLDLRFNIMRYEPDKMKEFLAGGWQKIMEIE